MARRKQGCYWERELLLLNNFNDELLPLRHVAQFFHSLLMLFISKPLTAPALAGGLDRAGPFRHGGQPALHAIFLPERTALSSNFLR